LVKLKFGSVFPTIENKLSMVESSLLRRKKRAIWSQTFFKTKSGEEKQQTPLALGFLKCSYPMFSMAGLLVEISFLFEI